MIPTTLRIATWNLDRPIKNHRNKFIHNFYLINSAYTHSSSQADRLKQAGGCPKSSPDANPVASTSGRLSPQSGLRGVLSKRFEDQRTNHKSTPKSKGPKIKENAPAFGPRERIALYGRHEGQTGQSGARTDKKKRIHAEARSKKKQQAAEAELETHFRKLEAHVSAAIHLNLWT